MKKTQNASWRLSAEAIRMIQKQWNVVAMIRKMTNQLLMQYWELQPQTDCFIISKYWKEVIFQCTEKTFCFTINILHYEELENWPLENTWRNTWTCVLLEKQKMQNLLDFNLKLLMWGWRGLDTNITSTTHSGLMIIVWCNASTVHWVARRFTGTEA